MTSVVNNGTSTIRSRPILWARKKMIHLLQDIQFGRIDIIDALGHVRLGHNNDSKEKSIIVSIEIKNMSVYSDFIFGGTIGAIESYSNNLWTTSDLVGLLRILLKNRHIIDHIDSNLSFFKQWLEKLNHAFKKNSVDGSKKNILKHYDLSNDFFNCFLDANKMYSSALYMEDEDSINDLNNASERKLDRIINEINLSKNSHLLEIGTGWGGFAIQVAKKTGCRVTTTTISNEQFNSARERIKEAGFNNQITVLNEDYRKLSGNFDALVSIEMIEAVGHQYINTYFEKCSNLLKKNAKAVIQAITIEDHRYEYSLKSVDFIKKYIFPGSFIPSNSVMVESAGKHRLRLINLMDFGKSYAKTLHAWRHNFHHQQSSIIELGFTQEFLRMWDFYFAYCEAGFLERSTSVSQLTFEKTNLN